MNKYEVLVTCIYKFLFSIFLLLWYTTMYLLYNNYAFQRRFSILKLWKWLTIRNDLFALFIFVVSKGVNINHLNIKLLYCVFVCLFFPYFICFRFIIKLEAHYIIVLFFTIWKFIDIPTDNKKKICIQ